MVYRVFTERKSGFEMEANALLAECREFLGIKGLERLRLLNRYDAEDVAEEVFQAARTGVFSEPQTDRISEDVDLTGAAAAFGVEPLPGQYDQRSDSAAQCLQLISIGRRPLVKAAKIYVLYGDITPEDVERIKAFVINPVESREASFELPETLKEEQADPDDVAVLEGFTAMTDAQLSGLGERLGLAMDHDDLVFLQGYFRDEEKRDPSITEVRIVDTYWSDHCRHTTFSTHLDEIELEDPKVRASYERYLKLREEVYGAEKAAARPQTLMDLATIGAKALKKRGMLPELDQSEEINACSIKVPVKVNGEQQNWLLMFKNETHNHPTEIEPFGGAATCIGGCIRDPLSGRAYVHQAMRLTGCGDPRTPLEKTLEGKLPQRQLAQTAAAGYSSYGNQIGLATGHVAEVYHEGYIAKHLECGVVVAAAPAENVVRERPAPGDVIILLGGRTGRDGIGGATGSSKSHNKNSLQTMASEVQKGNAPEERKIQRLFRKGEVTRLIKRCNDFGAGGVSVAIGELADGLDIDLDAVRKKYDGLDGTELAISESQERMAVVVAPENEEKLIRAAAEENLEAYRVAVVSSDPRMVMHWRGKVIANLSRAFLNTNGAVKHARVAVSEKPAAGAPAREAASFAEVAGELRCASRRGLIERFDSTIGAGSILMPLGGRTQRTPEQVMAALMPVLPGEHTEDGSVMAWGFDPDRMTADPYSGAYEAVYNSAAKLIAAGADLSKIYMTFQEFFEKLRNEPGRWGKPFSALLGALDAQMELGTASIGGKDSMSGSFMDLDVPPTFISFAIAPIQAGKLISGSFSGAPGRPVYLFRAGTAEERIALYNAYHALAEAGKIAAARSCEYGTEEALIKLSFGNMTGFISSGGYQASGPADIIAELTEEIGLPGAVLLGHTSSEPVIEAWGQKEDVARLLEINEGVLKNIYPVDAPAPEAGVSGAEDMAAESWPVPAVKHARPKVVIPVFPGTNCEYDTAAAFMEAGAEPEVLVVRNLSSEDIADSAERFADSVRTAQIVAIPGGFSGGDEPDGSAKFITAFFRHPLITERIEELLSERDGLMLGICNGFQALIKLGLVPFGHITEMKPEYPTLSFNTIGRHQSKLVRTRVCSNKSPWLMETKPGEIYTVPISHGEGRFIASDDMLRKLIANGQIATQYVDEQGRPSMDTSFNPNGSYLAIEGITSPDGRIFGKMGHSERTGVDLYRNVPGDYDMGLFRSAVRYFAG